VPAFARVLPFAVGAHSDAEASRGQHYHCGA
jgi:hypothetical protein